MSDIDFTTASAEQIAAVEPGEFIRIVKEMSDKDVREVMESPNREPSSTRSSGGCPSSSAPIVRARRRPRRTGASPGDPTAAPTSGPCASPTATCSTLPGHDGDSTLSLAMTPVDFAKVITKSGNPVMMFMTGKIKAKGDLGLAANIANFFDIPRA